MKNKTSNENLRDVIISKELEKLIVGIFGAALVFLIDHLFALFNYLYNDLYSFS